MGFLGHLIPYARILTRRNLNFLGDSFSHKCTRMSEVYSVCLAYLRAVVGLVCMHVLIVLVLFGARPVHKLGGSTDQPREAPEGLHQTTARGFSRPLPCPLLTERKGAKAGVHKKDSTWSV